MRVLLTADAVGGVFTYALTLAEALARRGTQTVLALLGPPASAAQVERARAVPGLTLVETGLPLEWLAEHAGQAMEAAAGVAALARRERVELVHLHLPSLALAPLGYPCPVVTVAHSCLATWWSAVRGEPLPPEYAWRRDLAGRGYLASHLVLAPSAAFAQATADTYGIDPPLVCHNGSDWPAKGDIRRPRAGVLAAGRLWDEGKGIGLLQSLGSLEAPIRIAGPLTEPGRPPTDFPSLDWLGSLDATALGDELSRTSVFVSPARYEPFGLTVLEAARAGCALVLSDIPTFRELWQGAAMFAPPGDAAAFTAALKTLLNDPGARLTLADAAQERASRYSARAMVECVLETWKPLLRQSTEAAA